MRKYLFSIVFIGLSVAVHAQDYTSYGIKGGLTVGLQNWNGSQSDPLVLPLGNGSIFTEIYAGGRSSIGLELGYHERGSALIQRAFQYQDPNNANNVISIPAAVLQRKFSNISFIPSLKQIYDIGNGWGGYYNLGARIEYTVKDTMPFHSVVDLRGGLNRINYGLALGGGLERRLGKAPIMMQIELQAHPDFSTQILSPAQVYYDVYSRNNAIFPEQKVVNTTFELTLGFKFVEYDKGEDQEE